jgi:hypothetical protein
MNQVATGMSEARSHQRRGKKTPTLASPGREALERENRDRRRSAEAVADVVKHPVPRLTAQSLRLCGASPLRKWRERAGNARGAGTRSSIGWQISVGRIARLLHREVARPVGEPERALARKKSVASPDAKRGWTEGETVRVSLGSLKVSRRMAYRFRLVGSQYDRRRSRANAHLTLTGWVKQKSSGS